MSFITKLDAMVEGLKADPKVHVAFYTVLPPNLEIIEKVETYLGYALDTRITDFYRECGGIQLFWLYKNNPEFDKKKAYLEEELSKNDRFKFWMFEGGCGLMSDGASYDKLKSDGVILIPPMKTTFLDIGHNGEDHDETEMFEPFGIFENTPQIKIRRLDMFDVRVNVAFILDGKTYPAMLVAHNGRDYEDSKVIYFEEYLNLIIETKGNINRGYDNLIV
jgi:hypothetical protein